MNDDRATLRPTEPEKTAGDAAPETTRTPGPTTAAFDSVRKTLRAKARTASIVLVLAFALLLATIFFVLGRNRIGLELLLLMISFVGIAISGGFLYAARMRLTYLDRQAKTTRHEVHRPDEAAKS